MDNIDHLIINNEKFSSRLFLGTGKFSSHETMQRSIQSSGTELVTLSLKRIDLSRPEKDILPSILNTNVKIMINTSGAQTAEEAFRIAILSQKAKLSNWIKLEIHPDPKYLLPDPIETLKAAKLLLKENFVVLPYIQPDPVLAKKLEDCGCATVMPLASPIGSNQGLKSKQLLEIIIEQSNIPVVVDAGLGYPSHASDAIEMGADAVLVNTAIAIAGNPIQMANAFRLAVKAGREAYLSDPQGISKIAHPTSPLTSFLDSIEVNISSSQ